MIKPVSKLVLCLFILLFSYISENNNTGQVPNNNGSTEKITARQLKFPSDNYIMVAAHRGGLNYGFPENSMAAISKSVELGVDILEIDVRITKDGKLVVIHDKTLDRTTNGTGKIIDYTLEEIKKLYLKDESGQLTTEKVPTLEEVIRMVGDKSIIFIDKAEFVLEEVKIILEKTDYYNNSLLLDFLEYKKALSRYGNLLSKVYYVPGIHESNPSLERYYWDLNNGLTPAPSAYAVWFQKETAETLVILEKAKSKRIPVFVSSTNDSQCAGHTDQVSLSNPENGWGWIIEKGANVIHTNYPKELLDYLKDRNLRIGY